MTRAQAIARTTDATPPRARPGPPATSHFAGIALLLLSMCFLSTLDASGKWAMAGGVSLLILSWVRYAVHLALALALIVPLRGWGVLRSRRPREQVLRGTAMLGATLMSFTTLHFLPQAEATAINFLAPLIVLASAPWVLGEPPRLSRWVAAAIAFGGVLLIIRPGGGLDGTGVVCGLLAACCFAGQYIATRRVAGDDPLTSVIWSGGMGAIALTFTLPFAVPAALPMLHALDLRHWLVVVSTGFTGCVGHLLQIGAYRRASASTLAPFAYLQIVTSTTTGWLIWGHFPDAVTWLGIAIICGSGIGIALLEWRRARRPATPAYQR
ncbi:EamA family transporter [Bordetella genomosp. 10]|uniref:EamA family transporter n=1 Tax=Bordetella genomosp. 10 TaxID=1416804 RepID=A0A261SAJ7_9BORD|nr:DMT family transporter [Bordetella genomosp. 10]OZI34428.1 EamA family transporter [Bordetella genomosp. 10]